MKIQNLKEFIDSTKNSKSSIYRFYKKNEELWLETTFKNNKRYFPVEHIKYFDSEVMFDENKVLRLENQSMKNLIDCLVDKDSLQYKLWTMEWSFFITVAYKSERNKKSCFRVMNTLYDELIATYGGKNDIRIFFSTEPFINRKGHHNHLVFYISNQKLLDEIKNFVYHFFNFDRVDISLYDKYKAGVFYACKEGLVNEDWDLLYNNENKQSNL
jgi:hypothetical protein